MQSLSSLRKGHAEEIAIFSEFYTTLTTKLCQCYRNWQWMDRAQQWLLLPLFQSTCILSVKSSCNFRAWEIPTPWIHYLHFLCCFVLMNYIEWTCTMVRRENTAHLHTDTLSEHHKNFSFVGLNPASHHCQLPSVCSFQDISYWPKSKLGQVVCMWNCVQNPIMWFCC